MATTEEVLLLRIDTQEPIKNLTDLRQNIKLLKEGFTDAEGNIVQGLNDMAIGSDEYKERLDELKVNQNALKDAMYATTSSFEDVAKAATGTGTSYNALVHNMAALKEEFRATEDAARRADIGAEIKSINDQLKAMDEMQGNFQRNVGNYANSIKDAFKDIGDKADSLRKGLGAATGGLNGFKDGMEGLSKSPAMATIGILVSLAFKLADSLKDNEDAMAAIKKAMEALRPVMDFFQGVLDTVVQYLVELIEKVGAWLGSSGLFNKIVNGVVGVGNAILQFVIAPFKGVVAAIKVFQDEGLKGIRNAAKAFGAEMKNGVSFKSNFEAGQNVATAMIDGVKSKKAEVKAVAQDIGKTAAEGIDNGLADAMKSLEMADKLSEQLRKEREAVEEETRRITEEFEAMAEADMETFYAEMDAEIAKMEEMRHKEEELAKTRIETLQQLAGATSSILGSIADMYESDQKSSEKNAKKVKALRIAGATIDTISGAVGAFASAASNPGGIPGMIIGAANAAAVTAAGLANIAKIRATDATGKSASANAQVTAPQTAREIPQVRTVTTASDEQKLNDMLSDQRVYILASDIEASQNSRKVQVAEASF